MPGSFMVASRGRSAGRDGVFPPVLTLAALAVTMAAPAIRAHPMSMARRDANSATDSGPRNSRVTARPSPILSMAT